MDISKNDEILGVYNINLDEKFDSFVRDIYKHDESIAQWKIDKKLETLNSYENKNVTILFLNVNVNKTIYHKGKKREVYINSERLKNSLRNKYSKKILNYFPDNIFHMTDDENEFEKIYPIIISYLNEYNQQVDIGVQRIRKGC